MNGHIRLQISLMFMIIPFQARFCRYATHDQSFHLFKPRFVLLAWCLQFLKTIFNINKLNSPSSPRKVCKEIPAFNDLFNEICNIYVYRGIFYEIIYWSFNLSGKFLYQYQDLYTRIIFHDVTIFVLECQLPYPRSYQFH